MVKLEIIWTKVISVSGLCVTYNIPIWLNLIIVYPYLGFWIRFSLDIKNDFLYI